MTNPNNALKRGKFLEFTIHLRNDQPPQVPGILCDGFFRWGESPDFGKLQQVNLTQVGRGEAREHIKHHPEVLFCSFVVSCDDVLIYPA